MSDLVRPAALVAMLAAATALTAPIQPPRIYANAAGGAAHVDTMPSDPPIIRDGAAVNNLCTGRPECNGGPPPQHD